MMSEDGLPDGPAPLPVPLPEDVHESVAAVLGLCAPVLRRVRDDSHAEEEGQGPAKRPHDAPDGTQVSPSA